jgi:glycosyltransferase involved in cell wall biosynthesis
MIDALAARFGGTAFATIQLARQLVAVTEVAAVTVVTRHGSIVARALADDRDVQCVTLPEAPKGELIRRVAWQATRLPRLIARENTDVLITMSGMLPRSPECRLICLLFNPVMYEERTLANTMRRWAARRTSRRAAYVAAPSHAMAELVDSSIGRECAVVPLGVDHHTFFPIGDPGGEILCVADFYAHKRHDLILDTWLSLPTPRPVLRLVGNPQVDRRTYAALLGRARSLAEPDTVVFEHDIPLAALVDAYRRARVFILPSERESFCMPLVESMASGVPALVRDLPSLRETGGRGASYVSGDDPADWAAALQPLLHDDIEHARARQAAVQMAAGFSWEAFAAKLALAL